MTEEYIDVPVRMFAHQANALHELAQKLGITIDELTERALSSHLYETPEVRRVKQLVARAEPRFPPVRLKSLQPLMVRITLFRRTNDILLLRQQAVLEEALAAARRGESLSYLTA